jgi:hypothetical protein
MAITKLPRNAIADDAINDSKIEDGTIAIAEVSGTVSAAKLNATLDISSKTVTLPNTSVTSDMLANTTVENAKLSNSAITVRGTSRALGSSFNLNVDVDWQSVKTGNTTMIAGQGYFVDTSSGAISMTLPSSAVTGDTIAIKDYAGTFASNNCTILRNGHNIQGVANNSNLSTNRASVVLVYVDSTKGWLFTNEHNVADLQIAGFTQATGGTVTTSGDFKIHSFTGDGCFVVSFAGNQPSFSNPSPQYSASGPNGVEYLVVAGGGGSGGGGGGAGGFRTNYPSTPSLTISTQTYPITVGAGGAAGPGSYVGRGSNGSPSIFSTITSAGGGAGGGWNNSANAGGSGGGGGFHPTPVATAGAGNTPPVSPPQGNPGGDYNVGGGGGAGGGGGSGGAGSDAPGSPTRGGGNGGSSTNNSITGSAVAYAGGGGGATNRDGPGSDPGGSGGGAGAGSGASTSSGDGSAASIANRGSGGGGAELQAPSNSGNGSKGVVIIRYKYQ